MNTSNNTILITGGTSGIGLELASQLLALGNTVIVTGRDQAKLDATKAKLPAVHTLQSDAGDPKAVASLYETVTQKFPALNILINNAGVMRKINFHDKGGDLQNLTQELEINLAGPIRMVKQFLPHLKSKPSAAVVNVSSGLAYIPLPISPVYCATKAGLHSFTQSLRVQMKNTSVKVFELAPPGTETPLLRGEFTDEELKGVNPMDVKAMVKVAIAGIAKDVEEIRPGASRILNLMSRVAPRFMLAQLSKSAEAMVAASKA